MAALTTEQFQRNQTHFAGINFHTRPSVKFNSNAKSIRRINEDVILIRNEDRILPLDLDAVLSYLGTMIDEERRVHLLSSDAVKYLATHGTSSLDFWLGETKLSDYGALIDDYDLAEVEEIHMQSASKYGW